MKVFHVFLVSICLLFSSQGFSKGEDPASGNAKKLYDQAMKAAGKRISGSKLYGQTVCNDFTKGSLSSCLLSCAYVVCAIAKEAGVISKNKKCRPRAYAVKDNNGRQLYGAESLFRGRRVSRDELKKGDLVFWKGKPIKSNWLCRAKMQFFSRLPNHVGIYVGNDKTVDHDGGGGPAIRKIDRNYTCMEFDFGYRVY